jgi:hypothetical protein
MHTSLKKYSRKQSRNLSKKNAKKGLRKSPKNEQEQHIQALRNHAKSSIHHKEVHTRSMSYGPPWAHYLGGYQD